MKSFKLIIILWFVSLSGFTQNITYMEYFVDNDPGYGNAVSIPFSGNEIAEADFTVPLGSLGNGLHLLYLRAQNQDGDWSITSVHHILKDVFQGEGGEISQAEYFIDTDPGYGNGNPVSVSSGEVVDIAFNLDVSGLDSGLHMLCLRTRTDDGAWSMTHCHHILVDVFNAADAEITGIEYYFDTDPGYGNGTPVAITPGQVVDVAFDVDISALSPGLHFLYLRTKSGENTWGNVHQQMIFTGFMDSDVGEITDVEYFIDNDPGIGNATPVAITSGYTIDLAFDVNLDAVDPGFHFINIRAKDENGKWSQAYTQLFLLDKLDNGNEPITYVEYFLDEDPGIGNATEVPITPGKVVELAFEVDLENAEPGFHFVNVRSQSENGTWSHAYTQLFLLDQLDSGEEPITYVEYFLDEDPGIGNATEVPITPGKVVELAFDIDLESYNPGFHFIHVRSQSANGTWSHAFFQMLYIDVLQSSSATPITYVEYYLDEDPGYGEGTPVNIVPASLVDVNIMPDISGLEPGFHTFAVRAQDDDGIWSSSNIHLFYLENAGDFAPDLVSVEYFLDEDPGFGNGSVAIIEPPTPVADHDFVVQLGNVEPGEHILYMRALDEFNNWSIVAYDTVNVEIGSEFALHFDGENDYLEAGDFQFPENDLTIEAWIKPNQVETTSEIVFAFGGDAGVQFRLNSDGSLLYGESAGGNWNYVMSEPASVLPDRWTHVAMSKAGDVCTLYINGYFAAVSQFDNNPVTQTLNIGGRSTNMDRFFDGDIDEVRLWETARTQQEINDNLCGTLTGNETGMYGLWHFDDGPDSPVTSDSGPNGFGAWLFNMNVESGPDCAWIDHACELPPSTDLAVLAIPAPDDLIWNEQGKNSSVSVLVKNYGAMDFDGEVNFSCTLDSGTPVEESQNLTIPAGESLVYEFATQVDLSFVGIHNLEVSLACSGDEFPENNISAKSIETVEIGRKVYAYNSWANQSGLPNGPVVFDLDQPGHVFSLADQSNLQFVAGATWVNDQWFGISNDSIFTIDTLTGARTFISLQDNFITSLAWDETTQKLFGLSWVSLYEIDPATGNADYIGYTGLEGFTAMACDTDGNLFALNTEDDQIYHINKQTAMADAIGPVGFNALYQQDMEYDPVNEMIYLTSFNEDVHQGELRTVNTTDGSTTYLGTFRGGMEISGFAIPYKEIIPMPVAQFEGNPQSGIVPLEVQFTDLSTGEIDSWYWEFGDGNFSTEQHPVYEYLNPGSYTVSLMVTNESGTDSETKEAYIEVNPVTIYDLQFTTNPGPDGTYPSEYEGQEVTVTGIVAVAGTEQYPGSFYITSPEGGPWNGIYVYNAIGSPEAGDFISLTGNIAEYNGMTEIHSPEISVISQGNPIPSPYSTTSGNMVYPETAEQWEGCIVRVNNVTTTQAANQFGEWFVDDGSGECQIDDQFYTYETYVGETFVSIAGAVDYSYGQYGINPRSGNDFSFSALQADFSASAISGFMPLTVDFTDLSGGEPDSWLWDFGDGQSSTEQNPTHVYETFGSFTVTLTVNSDTISDTEIKTDFIQVYQSQNGDWSLQHLCLENTPEAELMIRAGDIDNLGFGWPDGFDPFTGESTPAHDFPWVPNPEDTGGTDRIMVVTSYTGENVPCYADGYTGNTSRPENLPEPIVIDLCQLSQGEITSAALQIFVDDIQPESFCSQYTVKLNGQTLTSLQTIINHLDQSGPIGRMLTVRIPDDLLYLLNEDQLELEIDDFTTGAGDGFAIDFVKLLINEGALANSGTIDGHVYDNETGLEIEGAKVEASFWETATTAGDGSYNINEAPAGLVYIECRKDGYLTDYQMMNLSGGSNITVDFWLQPSVNADFTAEPLSGTAPLEVQFSDLSTGDPQSWTWNFGDGTSASQQNPVHIYTTPGIYTVSLTVSDGESSDDITKVNYISVSSPGSGNWLAEYFYDDDPGYGNGVPVFANGANDAMISFNASVYQLADGLHTFYLRSRNEDGSWSQTMSRPFIKDRLPGDQLPDVVYLEYFFDNDPGFGQGVEVPVDALSSLDIAVNLPLEELDYGLHTLYIRSKDANGRWSIVVKRSFIKGNYPGDLLKELVKAEYFIDEDPGQGNGEAVLFDPNNGIHEQQFDVNLDGYEWGEHMLYVRTMDESGSWSITVAEAFNVEEPPIIAEFSADITEGSVPLLVQFTDETYVSDPDEWLWDFGDGTTSTEQNPEHVFAGPGVYTVSLTVTGPEGTDTEVKEDFITVYPPLYALEYFFDTDPGYGNGNGVYAYSSNLGGFDFLVPVDELDEGYHLLFVRIQDTAHVWTQTFSRSILKTRLPLDPNPDVASMEYFVDDDPGFGEAVSLPVSQNPAPIVETLISLDGIEDGLHNIFVRSQDENGRWSETFVRPFLKSYVPGEMADISRLEYFIDTDPGTGNGSPVDIPEPQPGVERSFVVNLDGQVPGEHRLFVRAVDSRGHWSIVYNELFEVTATGAVQVVQLPEGWSGISSYIVPDDPNIQNIFAPVQNELVILQNFDGMYWPSAGVNTLGNWNDHAGYQVKMETAQQVTFSGSLQENLTASLSAGWNYLPVLNACDNDADELFSQIIGNLEIVKEVAGYGVYWPQFGINTLGAVTPGRAYFVKVDADVSLDFPDCTPIPAFPLKGEGDGQHKAISHGELHRASQSDSTPLSLRRGVGGEVVQGWGEVTKTPLTHTIAFPLESCQGLAEGSIISIYNQQGICCGAAVFQNHNLVITAFGDDPTTPQVDGLAQGEPLRFRFTDPETGNSSPMKVDFDYNLPNGENFATHGLSAIKSLQVTGVEDLTGSGADISIYPNPSNGIYHVSTLGLTTLSEFSWEITNAHGTMITAGRNPVNDFTIDISTHPKGIYYIKITQGGLQVVRKLVLQ